MEKDLENSVCREKVFNEIFREHSADLHKFLYYKYGSENNPADLVQEAFLKLWNNCARVMPEKARAFLFTVANNQMLNDLSRKKTVLNYSRQHPDPVLVEGPDFALEEKEYLGRLQKAIEELSDEQRVTFLLSRVEGKKHREIAEMLDISQKAVEKRIYKALAVLRTKLGEL